MIPRTLPSRLLCLSLTALVPALALGKAPKPSPHAAPQPPAAAAPQPAPTAALNIAYLAQPVANPVPAPFFDPQATDAGLQGARLGIADNNTTGRFTKQSFNLKETTVPEGEDPTAAFKALYAEGYRHFLLNLPTAALLKLQDLPEARQALLYDTASRDDALRAEACKPYVLHLLPSRAMRADALAQYFSKKRWMKWFLAIGPDENDRLFAEAVRHAAKKFGAKVVAEKPWEHSFDERRTPESEVPVFTQGADYEVLIVADEAGRFGDYLLYRTWQPRLVAGTQGLVPTSWHRTHEAWGALQLQNRFRQQAGRWMNEEDYGAWLAARAIGEAATRAQSVEFDKVKAYLLGGEFALAGFKGVPLSFRRWDLQLRQPVLVAADRSLVTVAPVEGVMHPKNELDTLGFDEAESKCKL